MPFEAAGRRVLVALVLAAAVPFGGCAVLDRDPGRHDLEPRETRLWVKPPSEDGATPVVGISVPW